MTTVVHLKRDIYDVYIGRGSRWGNPFKVGVHGDAWICSLKFYWWLKGYVVNDEPYSRKEMDGRRAVILRDIGELTGFNLGCCGDWQPGEPLIDCHAPILLLRANPEIGERIGGDGLWKVPPDIEAQIAAQRSEA